MLVNRNFAIRKYKVTPRISIAVVTNGPVAIAGSISNLSNISGTMDPIVAAIIMDEHIPVSYTHLTLPTKA